MGSGFLQAIFAKVIILLKEKNLKGKKIPTLRKQERFLTYGMIINIE